MPSKHRTIVVESQFLLLGYVEYLLAFAGQVYTRLEGTG